MRTDIHSPKSIVPSDYAFVGYSYLGSTEFGYSITLRKVIVDHMEKTGGRYSQHDHAGSCHICGANALYLAVFHHKPSNVYIKTGLDCADKMAMDCGNGDQFRKNIRKGLEAIAGKNKAKNILDNAGMSKAWEIFTETYSGKPEETIIFDMVNRLVKYGSLSDKQFQFMGNLLAKIDARPAVEAARAERHALAASVPVTEARISITGHVISSKFVETLYGTVKKMLVETAEGYRLYGSVPKGIRGEQGDKVSFVAKIEPYKDDAKFGFFSRPKVN